jgi:hypothetical protein
MIRQETQSGNPVRTATALNAKLNKGLAAYVAAASAAGVGMLAWAQPADAEVVYTPANTPIMYANSPVALDLNNDGTADFELTNFISSYHSTGSAHLKVGPAQPGNGIWAVPGHSTQLAAPVFWGVVVGLGREFHAASAYMDKVRFDRYGIDASSGFWGKGDPLAGSYLGLKFTVGGEVHYGWARLTVKAKGKEITATLTGYAYETVPNRPIITGMTHGTLDTDEMKLDPLALGAPQPTHSTLGDLALGAIGKSIRKQ